MPFNNKIRLLYITHNASGIVYLQDHLSRLGLRIEVTTVQGDKLFELQSPAHDIAIAEYSFLRDTYTTSQIKKLATLLPLIVIINPGDEAFVSDAFKLGAYDYVIQDKANGYLTLLPAVIDRALDQERLRIEQDRHQGELEDRDRSFALLTRVGQELIATHDFQEIVGQLLQAVTETVGAEGASIWLWDEDKPKSLICQAVYHNEVKHKLVNLSVASGEGVVGWVAQHQQSTIVPCAKEDPRFSAKIDVQINFKTRSLLAVPLFLRNEILGVLELVNKLAGDFTTQDRLLIETLSASAAIAIDNARLVEALREKTAELERQNEDLDAFAHTVAHDLKNPLGIIAGTAQVLETDYDYLTEEMIRYHLNLIVRNGRKATNIIEELLLLAELRQPDIYLEPLYMEFILQEVQERLGDMAEIAQAVLIFPDNWPVALGYAPWVEEIWFNYISNALKYGGEPPQIKLGAKAQADNRVRFWVQDNGPGLNHHQQNHVFKPFQRFNRVRAQGHGLGLSIVRRIAEKLGGEVAVESTGIPGEGSTFSFVLPGVAK